MVKRDSDGFFNLHTVSFFTLAIFLTVFSVAYGDWHSSKITGYAVEREQYQDFADTYLDPRGSYIISEDYAQEISDFVDAPGEATAPDYVTYCIIELNGEEHDAPGHGCSFFAENVVSRDIDDPEAFDQWVENYYTPFTVTASCTGYVGVCDKEGVGCNGIVALCYYTHEAVFCDAFEDFCYVPETSEGQIIQGSTKPPEKVVEEVSQKVDSVKESAKYASEVKQIIDTKPLTEEDLTRYKINLEEAKKRAAESYSDAYSLSSKYSSFVLSEYQEEIVVGLSDIDKQLKDIDEKLSGQVTERFEAQAEQANWEINRKEIIKVSLEDLEALSSKLPSLGRLGDIHSPGEIVIPGQQGQEQQEPEAILRIESPGTIQTSFAQNIGFDINIINDGQVPLENCRISALGSYGTWFTYQGFSNPQYGFNSLGPGQTGTYTSTINPGFALPGIYFINFRVTCNPNTEEDGLTLTVQITNDDGENQGEIQTGQTGQISEEQLEAFLGNYSPGELNLDCQSLLNDCSSQVPNTCGEFYQVYDCAVNGLCDEFGTLCLPNYISELQMNEFISEYVAPYYNLPNQCLLDISLCSTSSYSCPSYIYNCAVEADCDEYVSTCVNAPGAQIGSGSSGGGSSGGGNSGGSSTGSIIPVTTGTGNTGFPEGGLVGACKGDKVCIALADTCLTPSYIIATSLDLTDFGGFGYNAVTGDICYMGSSRIYLKPGLFERIGGKGVGGSSGGSSGGSNPGTAGSGIINPGNSIISIHFQNGLEGAKRNYVAAIVYSLDGHLTLNFLNSPDYNGLEDKIQEFIQNLLYGGSEGSYVTGMSLQQAEEIVSSSSSVPWVLWIILFVMVVAFVLFGNLLAPYDQRLISSGKKALNRKDYSVAIQNYNELANNYSSDVRIKQDALDYLKQIKERVGNNKINLEFREGSLPIIKTNNVLGVFTDYSRVHKMIDHAMQDVKKSPKLAKSRLPLISEEYKRLSPKDKERLASKYEALVYKISSLK